MGEVRYLHSSQDLVFVSSLGACRLKAPTGAVERMLAPYYVAPDTEDAEAFVDKLLSHCVAVPRVPYDAVRNLSQPGIQQLRVALADLLKLPSGAGISDRALLRAMAARHQRILDGSEATTRGSSIAEFIDELSTRLHAWVRGDDPARVLIAAADVLHEGLTRHIRRYEGDRYAFIADDMLAADGLSLLNAVRDQGEHVLVDALDEALAADQAFLRDIANSVRAASGLPPTVQEELCRGLTELSRRDWVISCRLLLGGVEGALWSVATSRGVVDANRSLPLAKHGPRHAKGISTVLLESSGLKIGRSFRRFLTARLFDQHGHDLRHGRAQSGHPEYSLWAIVALCGLLDRELGTGLMTELGERIAAHVVTPAKAA